MLLRMMQLTEVTYASNLSSVESIAYSRGEARGDCNGQGQWEGQPTTCSFKGTQVAHFNNPTAFLSLPPPLLSPGASAFSPRLHMAELQVSMDARYKASEEGMAGRKHYEVGFQAAIVSVRRMIQDKTLTRNTETKYGSPKVASQ